MLSTSYLLVLASFLLPLKRNCRHISIGSKDLLFFIAALVQMMISTSFHWAMLAIAVALLSVDSFQPIKARNNQRYELLKNGHSSFGHLNRLRVFGDIDRNTVVMMATNDYSSYASKREIDVVVEAPTFNSRKITASVVVNSPVEDVWGILTEYERLAERVPNLVKSYVVSDAPSTNSGGYGNGNSREGYNGNNNGLAVRNKINARIYQEGAQKVPYLT